MTDRSKLLSLAEAVEKLAGPDRETDWHIQQTLGIGYWPDIVFWPPFVPGSKADKEIPLYTASLDAAMTLVDDDWGYEQRRPSNGCKSGCFVQIWWVPEFPKKQHGMGATPALALCAAALRAQAEALS